ncbi:hypothetical protein [Metabacillus herbersteinensis]|uniref:hypothetical protein n=1 Tax=Metabacillus herbersteinensis TaxID=283816 RepID=UPI00366E0453
MQKLLLQKFTVVAEIGTPLKPTVILLPGVALRRTPQAHPLDFLHMVIHPL